MRTEAKGMNDAAAVTAAEAACKLCVSTVFWMGEFGSVPVAVGFPLLL